MTYAFCRHLEINNSGLGTTGYEAYIFDYGIFKLLGDGGYSNWRFSFKDDVVERRDSDPHVNFKKIE